MKVKRVISVYNLLDDKLIREIDLGNIQVSLLSKILTSNDEDPNFYMIYKLNKEQFLNFIRFAPLLSTITFDSNVEIYLESYQE